MSWYYLTSGDERSAIKIEGYARNDDAREALSKLRGASLFLCAAPAEPAEPAEPVEPIEPSEPAHPIEPALLFRLQSMGRRA